MELRDNYLWYNLGLNAIWCTLLTACSKNASYDAFFAIPESSTQSPAQIKWQKKVQNNS